MKHLQFPIILHVTIKKIVLQSVDQAYGEGTMLRSYEIDFECFGYVHTSHYDNVTGEWICWPFYKEPTQEQLDKMYTLREADERITPKKQTNDKDKSTRQHTRQ